AEKNAKNSRPLNNADCRVEFSHGLGGERPHVDNAVDDPLALNSGPSQAAWRTGHVRPFSALPAGSATGGEREEGAFSNGAEKDSRDVNALHPLSARIRLAAPRGPAPI